MTNTRDDRHVAVVVFRDHAGTVKVRKTTAASHGAAEAWASTYRRVLSTTIVKAVPTAAEARVASDSRRLADMTPEERAAVVREAVTKLTDELERAAPAIAKVLADVVPNHAPGTCRPLCDACAATLKGK
jgi:hypothetical protein